MLSLAAALADIGFGNAGVHLPHGMSYPVASIVESSVFALSGQQSKLIAILQWNYHKKHKGGSPRRELSIKATRCRA